MQQASGDMVGKICLVTGGNAGIGKETALGLARLGATVAIVSRNRERGETALAEIKAKTGNQNLTLFVADLASQKAVRQLAEDFKASYDRLHVLINNAGLTITRRTLTPDGLEATFAINHLAPFLLTNLLLDLLKVSTPARIITVSSAAHYTGSINFNNLQLERFYTEIGAYSQSKLANVLFTYELARRLRGTGVTANCLHPGIVRSNFAGSNVSLFGLMFALSRPFQISPAQGAQTSIYLASSPQVATVSGKYFTNKRPAMSSPLSNNEQVARRLWEVSTRLTKLPLTV